MEYRYRDASEMKDSGVEWIGKIPKDISIKRLKYDLVFQKGNNPREINNEGKGIPYIGASDFGSKKYSQYTTDINLPICIEEDLLILWDGARAGIVDYGHKGAISSTVVKVENKNNLFLKKYYNWYMKSFEKYFVDMSNGTTIPHMNRKFLENLLILEIPLKEQRKIVNFLDKKTSEFDSIISKKEALIEKLEEAKKSLISEVITGKVKVVKTDDGYDLVKRSSDEMKDSGVEYIGYIPNDWKISRIKNFTILKSIKNKPHLELLSLYREYGVVPKSSRDDNNNRPSEDLSGYKYVQVNDLVLNKMKVWQGSLAISKYEGIVSPAYIICGIDIEKMKPMYVHYLLRNKLYIPEYRRLSTGIRPGQWDMNYDNFKNIKAVIPSTQEQGIIIKYLDEKINNIDNLVIIIKQQIEKLKEAKQSLISEAVTGKIEILD